MFAVIRTGGKQYKVKQGDIIDIELLPSEKDPKKATISEVLLVGSGEQVKIGKPTVAGASVALEVVDSIKGPKVIAYKYRKREGYHRTVGHRQKMHRVKVTAITG